LELKKDFRLSKLDNLKLKHVKHLVDKWKKEERPMATIQNRVSHIRWLAQHLGKINMISPKNADLGIESRSKDYNENKGWTPSQEFTKSLPERLEIQVGMMREFGLRFKEASLFRVNENVKKESITVTYGTKGGRDREVLITTEGQKEVLEKLKSYVDSNRTDNILERGESYKSFEDTARNSYRDVGMVKEGVGTPHGLRHQYAQDRYEKLSGWKPPVKMSEAERVEFKASMTHSMKEKDILVRKEITEELGHSRISIVANYIGKL
jgi:integrase